MARIVGLVATLCALVGACSVDKTPHSPQKNEAVVNPKANKLSINHENQIQWNGVVVSEQQLRDLLRATRELASEPELRFQPDADASYELSAKVLEAIKTSGASKFGFVGNEMYVAPEPSEKSQ